MASCPSTATSLSATLIAIVSSISISWVSSVAIGPRLAEIVIVLPDEIDEASQEMIRGLEERYSQAPRANLEW